MGETDPIIETPLDVLIVEDNAVLTFIIRKQLALLPGISAHFLKDGKQALESVQAKMPTLLILDVYLPSLNAFEIVASLRHRPESAELPLIIHSSNDLSAQEKLALTLGNTRFVIKGNTFAELGATVAELLDLPVQQQ